MTCHPSTTASRTVAPLMDRHSRKSTPSTTTHQFLYSGRMVRINCEPGSRIDECLMQEKFYEHRMLGYITRTSRAGAFIDIGANCGHHSVYFSLFAPSTRVYAFEPFPNHYDMLVMNRSENRLDSKLIPFPVGAAEAHSIFEIRTNSAIHQSRYTGSCVPIDSVVHEPVSLMKVDVEGMELQALKGARRVISEYKPQIFVESHTEAHLQEIVEFLVACGYRQPETSFNASPTWEFVPA